MTATLTRCRTILYLGDVIKSFNKEKTSKDDDDDDDADDDNDCLYYGTYTCESHPNRPPVQNKSPPFVIVPSVVMIAGVTLK